jgi:hypothetical protein
MCGTLKKHICMRNIYLKTKTHERKNSFIAGSKNVATSLEFFDYPRFLSLARKPRKIEINFNISRKAQQVDVSLFLFIFV